MRLRLRFGLLPRLALPWLTIFGRLYQRAIAFCLGIDVHDIALRSRLRTLGRVLLTPVWLCILSVLTTLIAIILRVVVSLLTVLILLLLLRLTLGLLTLSFRKHPQIVFRVLLEVFGCHPVVRQLCVPGQLIIFINDLLRRSANLAFGPG